MAKRKKGTLLVIFIFMLVILILIISLVSPKVVYKEVSDNDNFEVVIQSSDFFQIASMGGREYTLIVYEKNKFLNKKIFSETFWFNNDGSPIADNNISVDWNSDNVTITIDSEEMNAKLYTIYYVSD